MMLCSFVLIHGVVGGKMSNPYFCSYFIFVGHVQHDGVSTGNAGGGQNRKDVEVINS